MTRQFLSILSFMASNIILIYAGVGMFRVTKFELYTNYKFIIGSFVAIVVARALNIYSMSFLLNRVRWTRINGNVQHMLVLSGFKGVMAYALSTNNPFQIHEYGIKTYDYIHRMKIINATTTIIILVTVVFWGGFTIPLLKCLNIPMGKTINTLQSN